MVLETIAIATAVAGIATSLFGASEANQVSEQIAQNEIAKSKVQRQAMRLTSKRQQLEVFRNMQMARALSLTAATNQGAQGGSGLEGGLAQVNQQGQWQLLGIRQNAALSEKLFSLNMQGAQLQSQMSDAQNIMNIGQGLTSLGGVLGSPAMANTLSGLGFGSVSPIASSTSYTKTT